MKDNPYQTELPNFILLASGKYRDYYNNLPQEQKKLIETQAELRKLDTNEAVDNFLATRLTEAQELPKIGFKIPKFNSSELNEDSHSKSDSVVAAMQLLK